MKANTKQPTAAVCCVDFFSSRSWNRSTRRGIVAQRAAKPPLCLRSFCSNSVFARRSRPSGLFTGPGVGGITVGDVTVVKSSVCFALQLDDIFRPVRILQGLVDAFGRSATCKKVEDGR